MNDRMRWSGKRLLGYVGCTAVAIGCFLPFRHVLFRDVGAFDGGLGLPVLVLAAVAVLLISSRRFAGASFCAAAILLLLGLQYILIAHVSALSSIIWNASTATADGQSTIDPAGLGAHPDVGFYVIVIGALGIMFAQLYPGGNATVEDIRGSAYAVPKSNGHATIGERKLDRADRAE